MTGNCVLWVSLLLFSDSVVSASLRPHELQCARLPSPSIPRVCSNSGPSSWWCHQNSSPSVIPLSSCLQSFPESGSFAMSWLLALDDQSIGVSASVSVPPMNIQDWFPLGLTGLISLQSKGLSRVYSNATVQRHQFFGAQTSCGPSLTSIRDYWKKHSFYYMDLCQWSNVSAS